ncbi:RNA polymerase sigma factor SigY [Kroppenstedtia pulmonis]|uniref:RNA polymerase sigma factor SigY n=1 Tax=Kroppenstedtia pulmonis TaxID=1380685 RepID=A0A7D4BWA7_9BACL|nr:RNA polymerase sigma factor SigY [Kroppenstedtia pulmonis]QKG84713.1 RNA polymerase sigma factor SigY [Kroppenstedtia pulmonis]
MEEQQWIQQAKRGDSHALARLLHKHYPFLIKVLTKITLNPLMAEDLAQETVARCIEKIHLYREQAKFSSWLITIATRLYMDECRKDQRKRRWIQEQQHFGQWKRKPEEFQEDWMDVVDALGTLKEDARTCLILKHYYGYAYDEIASMIGVPTGTVKSRVHHAIMHVRKELKHRESGQRDRGQRDHSENKRESGLGRRKSGRLIAGSDLV